MMYDLAIIGGGPAGVAAGVYASRKRLKTVFITVNFEGQSTVSEGVENWIGTTKIPGNELSENLKKHLEAYAGDSVDIQNGEQISLICAVGAEVRAADMSGARAFGFNGSLFTDSRRNACIRSRSVRFSTSFFSAAFSSLPSAPRSWGSRTMDRITSIMAGTIFSMS